MIAPIKGFAHALMDEQFATLFSLYPEEAFEEELQIYKDHSPAVDITVHYFRLSRILRELLFTCSSIDFGYQMFEQTRAQSNPDFSYVRFYDLNQSMLTPMWKGAGMPYVGVSHGSDTNFIFNGVFPEGEITGEDTMLSQSFARSFINFAATGDPNLSSPQGWGDWPPAFQSTEDSNILSSTPSSVHIQVIGGPHGTGSTMTKASANPDSEDDQFGYTSDHYGADNEAQSVLNMGSMDSPASQARQHQLEQENLFERCAYINTLADTLGI
jgi:hypothetical protein